MLSMRGIDRGTSSVLFHKIDKVTQAYCLFGLKREKNSKYSQINVENKDAAVIGAYEITEASTDTSYDDEKNDSVVDKKNKKCACYTIPKSKDTNELEPKVGTYGDISIIQHKNALTQSSKQKKKKNKEIHFLDGSTETQKKKISKSTLYKQSAPLGNDDVPFEYSKRSYHVNSPIADISLNEKSKKSLKKIKHEIKDNSLKCMCDKTLQTNLKFKMENPFCKAGPCLDTYQCLRARECACNQNEYISARDDTQTLKEKSTKPLKQFKRENKFKSLKCMCDKTLHTNVNLEIKDLFCQAGPCSNTYRCPRSRECACSGKENSSAVDNIATNNGKNISDRITRKHNIKVTSHHKKLNKIADVENVFAEGPKLQQDICKEGVCVEATRKKDLNFICKCKLRKKKEVNECSDNTCYFNDATKTTESSSTIVKLQKKIYCLCRKYSGKIKEKHRSDVKSLPAINKKTCKITFPISNVQKTTGSSSTIVKLQKKIYCLCRKYSGKIKERRCSNVTSLIHHKKLNKIADVQNVFAEGPKLQQDICKEGVCVEATRKKDLNFICKCKLRKKKEVNECSDNTCYVNDATKTTESSSTIVKLQKKIYCLCRKYSGKIKEKRCSDVRSLPAVNKETCEMTFPVSNIQKSTESNSTIVKLQKKMYCLCRKYSRKIKERRCSNVISLPVNGDICKTGLCRDAFNKQNKTFKCSCKKPVKKCTDENCSLEKLRSAKSAKIIFEKMCKRCRSRNGRLSTKTIRKPLDTKKVTSKIKSKSENWSLLLRPENTKECQGITPTQIRKMRKPIGFKISTDDKNYKNISICYCKNCKRRNIIRHTAQNLTLNTETVTLDNNQCGDAFCAVTKPVTGRVIRKSLQPENTPVSNECQGITPTNLRRTNEVGGLKIHTSDRNKETIHMCHCNKFKRRKMEQQPDKSITTECGDVSCGKRTGNASANFCGVCCKCKNSLGMKQSFICKSFSSFMRKKRKSQNKEIEKTIKTQREKIENKQLQQAEKVDKKQMPQQEPKLKDKTEPVNKKINVEKKQMPLQEPKLKDKTELVKKKKVKAICKCHHECQCHSALKKIKKKSKPKLKPKPKPKPDKRKVLEKKKENARSNKKLKEFEKGDAKFHRQVRRKGKAEKKKQMKLYKQQKKELERQTQGKEKLQETSCLADFFVGILKIAYNIAKTLAFVIISFIVRPKVSYRYARARVRNPRATYERIKKWAREWWQMKKLQMNKTLGGSETVSILSDTVKDQTWYQAFADKGKTKKERQNIELENKNRKRRIKKRHDFALYSCRHNLLTTLRKTPCLWVYHICPECYPQCLSLLAFWRKFSNMMLFCLAFAVWTPCIVAYELCRGLMCCTFCMG